MSAHASDSIFNSTCLGKSVVVKVANAIFQNVINHAKKTLSHRHFSQMCCIFDKNVVAIVAFFVLAMQHKTISVAIFNKDSWRCMSLFSFPNISSCVPRELWPWMEEKDLTLRRHTPLSINIGLAFAKVLKTYEKAKKNIDCSIGTGKNEK